MEESDIYFSVSTDYLTIETSDNMAGWKYRCVIDGTPDTNEGKIEFKLPSRITDEPFTHLQIVEKDKGNNLKFTIIGQGEGTLTYWWKQDKVQIATNGNTTINDDGQVGNNITTNLAITGVTDANASDYVCYVKGECGIAESNPIKVTTYRQPPDIEACPFSDAIFDVSIKNAPNKISYLWEQYYPPQTNPYFPGA